MGHIIAARLPVQDRADDLVSAIADLGISRDKIAVFYINPDGRHHLLPLGGDKSSSPGALKSGKGAWIGTGVGAAAGAAAGSLAGPIGAVAGAGVGAYTGSLTGAMAETDKNPETSDQTSGQEQPVDREPGLRVATEVDERNLRDVVTVMRQHDGAQIEEAEGRIENSEWIDFDPTQPVHLVP